MCFRYSSHIMMSCVLYLDSQVHINEIWFVKFIRKTLENYYGFSRQVNSVLLDNLLSIKTILLIELAISYTDLLQI